MQLGVQLAHLGPLADASAVRTAATSADVLGYHSLWAVDPRLLPGPAGHHPAGLEPVTALSYAAAVTEHVRLGVHLCGRPLAAMTDAVDALDALSTERLVVAIDLDDEPDSAIAGTVGGLVAGPRAGAAHHADTAEEVDRADGVDGVLAALRRPRRPLLVSSRMTERAAAHIARSADGWMAMRLGPAEIRDAWRSVVGSAHALGRDPDQLRLVVRVDIALTDRPLGHHRSTYCGSTEQVVDDLVALAQGGATEAVLALPGQHHLDDLLGAYAAIAEGLELRTPS